MNSIFSRSGQSLTTLSKWNVTSMKDEKDKTLFVRSIISFLKKKQMNYLNSVLERKSMKHSNIQDQYQYLERRFHETLSEKSRMANLLFQEERNWKRSLEAAEKKKLEATSTYVLEFNSLRSKLKMAQEGSLPETDSSLKSVIHSLEVQKENLKEIEKKVFAATNELNTLREKGDYIQSLTKRFQEVRGEQLEASQNFHEARANWNSASKELAQIHWLINFISSNNDITVDIERKPISRMVIMATRFWIHVGELFAITIRQRY